MPQEVMENPAGVSLLQRGTPIFVGDSEPIQHILEELISELVGPDHIPHQLMQTRGVLEDHGGPAAAICRLEESLGPTRPYLGERPIPQA